MPARHAGRRRASESRGAKTAVKLARGLLQPGLPIAHLLVGFVAADAIALLDAADQLVALAADAIELVVGQLALLLLGLALELAPIAFDAVPVHHGLLQRG